jgi:hypothetical protein
MASMRMIAPVIDAALVRALAERTLRDRHTRAGLVRKAEARVGGLALILVDRHVHLRLGCAKAGVHHSHDGGHY